MSNKKTYHLKTDHELKRLVLPLTTSEQEQLEKALYTEGYTHPVRVWNSTILVDYTLYHMYQIRQAAFPLQKIPLQCKEEAIIWICKNQLSHTELTEEMRRYLIGKQYLTELILGKHQSGLGEYDGQVGHTTVRIGKEYHVHPLTIKMYGKYTSMIDKVYRTSPEAADMILRGKLKISQENLAKATKLPPDDFRELLIMLTDNITDKNQYQSSGAIIKQNIGTSETEKNSLPICSIKNMPDYDPDAAVSSLILTIPSWIQSINRVVSASDMNTVSLSAKSSLEHALNALHDTIRKTLVILKEENDGRSE